MSNNYRPAAGSGEFVRIADYRAELARLKQAQERASPHITWAYLAAEPEKIVAGMEVLADGTNWDPGSIAVAAKYRRNEANTAWELIEAIVVAAGLAAHLADTVDAHDASAISYTPTGGLSATDVDAALDELEAEKQPLDATLTALAAANWAANALPIGTGADTLAQTAFAANTFPARASTGNLEAKAITDAALTVLDDASTAAMLTTLGAQPVDATLTALAAYNTNGLLTQTAADTFAGRTITGTAGEITLTNGNGVSGNPTVSLPATLQLTGKVIVGGTYDAMVRASLLNEDAAGFDLQHKYNSATASANRSVAWDVNNASRGINMSGNLIVSAAADVSGTNTGDETLARIGTQLDSAAAKTPLVDADVVITLDSAAGNAVKKWSFLNVKANLKTYFDTLYQVLDADLTSWAAVVRATGFDTWAATPSSANLLALLTTKTGTGSAVFNDTPTLIAPLLGTPTSGNLANCTFPTLNQNTTGNAGTVTVANEASDTSCFPLFGTASSGSLAPKTNANMTFNSSTGVVTFASSVLTTADINGGTVDGAIVGGASAAAGTFTTLTATGQLVISGAGAGQIVFPGTQNSSSDANTLDDYEEGSWTPVPRGSGTAGTPTGTFAGSYVKVGRIASLWGNITFTALTGMVGSVIIGGAPFTTTNATQSRGSCHITVRNNFTNDFPMGLFGDINTTDLFMRRTDIDNTSVAVGDLAATSTFQFQFTQHSTV